MKKRFTTMKEVKEELRVLRLQRDIDMAQLENKKLQMENGLTTYNVVTTLFDALKKYGVYFLIKKIFK